MNLLHPILTTSKNPPLIGALLMFSALTSTNAFADQAQNGFPPPPLKTSPVTTTPLMVMPRQNLFYPPAQARGYYPAQQIQRYKTQPYSYYYPQQQMPVYAPMQWGSYPQQQQQQATMPYYAYPVTPYPMGNSSRYYNIVQLPAQQNPAMTNAPAHNSKTAQYPMRKKIKQKKQAWGNERHIWPDFYTGFTGEAWDKMISAPYDAGRMPGGWRAPSLSTPDPVTVGDAITNQLPPIAEEMGNMTNFTN